MRLRTAIGTTATGLFLAGSAFAQFFPHQSLPDNDFTWTWGDKERSSDRLEDFSITGYESVFDCNLTGILRPASSMSTGEMRDLEEDLRSNFYFVRSASRMMSNLESRGELEWAELACALAQPRGKVARELERRAEREAQARERAARELERRRAQREREEAENE